MKMHHQDGVFWVDSTREEYLTPKAAGFLWHPTLGCLGACMACPLGLAKKWWTKVPTNALKLIKFADAEAAAALETLEHVLVLVGRELPRQPTLSDEVPTDGGPEEESP